MKKLRKISLDSLDRLSDSEASLLFGGGEARPASTPTPFIFMPTSIPKATNRNLGYEAFSNSYNKGDWDAHGSISKGVASENVKLKF